jgi:hypothetical protein
MAAENTDLERRVLAHEQILQALIAHMAEVEPKFLHRLRHAFTERQQSASEHDHIDTDAYAQQFIHQVMRLVETREAEARHTSGLAATVPNVRPRRPSEGIAIGDWRANVVSTFRTVQRDSIWHLTLNDRFYGDYLSEQPAVDAAHSAANAMWRSGTPARVLLCQADGNVRSDRWYAAPGSHE